MPTYELPPLPKPKKRKRDSEPVSDGQTPDQWRRTITIPVNDEILEMLMVGDKVSIELIGEVVGTRNTESKSTENEYIDKSIEVSITQVSAYPKDDANEREEEGMEHGYRRG